MDRSLPAFFSSLVLAVLFDAPSGAVTIGSPLTFGTLPDRVTFLYPWGWPRAPNRIRMDVGATINPIAMPLSVVHEHGV